MVFDTNVIIDGFSDDFSAQARLIEAASNGEITALITPPIEREYNLILGRLINDDRYRHRINDFLETTEQVEPVHVDTHIDDAEDYKFLQAAVGGKADLLVTHDQHLLVVGTIEKTRVLRPQEAWAVFEEESGTGDGAGSWADFARGLGIGG